MVIHELTNEAETEPSSLGLCSARRKKTICQLQSYTQAQFEDLKQLMSELMELRVEKECSHSLSRVATEEAKGQLSDRVKFTKTDLMLVLKDTNCHLYAILESLSPGPSSSSAELRTGAGEGRIIGCATLCVFHSPTGTKASVEDVVVSSAYRGQHLGKKLMEYVLEQAKAYAPIELHLTSSPMRFAANRLYQSLGFQKKETNCYQMMITDETSSTADNDSLKQSITYLIGKERADGNHEPLTAEYISRVLKVDVGDVRKVMESL